MSLGEDTMRLLTSTLLISACTAFIVRDQRSVHISLSAAASNAISGVGSPSNPGWNGRLNRLTEWADEVKPNRPIICEYKPDGWWLWSKWNGTVLKATWKSVALAMLTGLVIDFVSRGCSWSKYKPCNFSILDTSSSLVKRLSPMIKCWEYQLGLGFSTFILTFFLSQAFSYWQKVYNTTRMIQGRINGKIDTLVLCLYNIIVNVVN